MGNHPFSPPFADFFEIILSNHRPSKSKFLFGICFVGVTLCAKPKPGRAEWNKKWTDFSAFREIGHRSSRVTLPKTNSLPPKIGRAPKGNELSSNHQFSRANC